MKLLSINADAKTSKSTAFGYLVGVQYFAPYKISGKNICPMAAKAKCHVPCLNTAGRGVMSSVQKARVNRTQFFLNNKKEYFEQLSKEIKALEKKAKKLNLIPAVRLNGTSDIRWENYDIIPKFSHIQWYDYTKISNRKNLPENYHLTWSFSAANIEYARNRPKNMNWAVVFDCKVPKTFLGRKVIDGDITDTRFLDPDNVVVGLSAKGRAKKDQSGFVVRDPVALTKILDSG